MPIFEEPNLSQDSLKVAFQSIIATMMDNTMGQTLYDESFNKEIHWITHSLYGAFVPNQIFKGPHFERQFVSLFGKALKSLAAAAAPQGIGYAETDKRIDGLVKQGRLRRIAEILNRLEFRGEGRVEPNWDEELAYILAGRGEDLPVTVIADVYAMDTQSGERLAFELKAPLPNNDITKVSKEKILKLHCMEPKQVDGAYFALPYNFYGTRENFSWGFPSKWFNMQQDSVVLIGNEFWERIGGAGTYKAFIDAVNESGLECKTRIYQEYLGIEPPDEVIRELL